jgi:FkbM family methyltransferase
MNIVSPGNFFVKSTFPTSIINSDYNDVSARGIHNFIIPGVYERSLIDWAKQFVTPDSTFVDVGAHIGSWTLLMSKLANQVVAFEPQRMRYYQLCGNISVNDLSNVRALNYALANPEKRNSTMVIHKFGVDTGCSTLREDVKNRSVLEGTPVSGTETIDIKCLDDFEIDKISLMKIDVEGFELEVLQGALRTLQRCKPFIIIELWSGDWFKESRETTIQWLRDHDYHVGGISGYADYYICSPK